MTTQKLKPASISQLAAAAETLLKEGILSKGGPQPSPKALDAAVKFLALKAQRAQQEQKAK